MSVEFDEPKYNNYKTRTILGAPQTSSMVNWITKIGIAKNDRQAKNILLLIIVVALTASVVVFSANPFVKKQSLPAGFDPLESFNLGQTK